MKLTRRFRTSTYLLVVAITLAGCGWHGLNSLPLPGTEGNGDNAYTIQAQLPDVDNIQQNSRVRVGDVTVGNVTNIERQGWHALVTMRIDGGVKLPANATAKVGQTSLLGSLHIELAPPTDVAPEGILHDKGLIPLSSGAKYPSTEQTLASLSLLLNGGGIGQIQDITKAFSTAFSGREDDVRSLIIQLGKFIDYVNDQKHDILNAIDSLNRLAKQFADQEPVVDTALNTLPDALSVLKDERKNLADMLTELGKFSALAAQSTNQTRDALTAELKDAAPVLDSLSNAGPALTRSLSVLTTFPWVKENVTNWFRGDYANSTVVFDLTLNRLDPAFFAGTRFEGNLTELEMQWGRTIGQLPSPYTSGNPIVTPYRADQGR
jgi:phospholipid/cholesterol/gamma-HCH transport system substrate-binding protein